jgi:UDP:flavonoid glycosyltransferase YjiC (YdhE family)
VRLDTYGHEPEQLLAAVDRLLADRPLADRLGALARELQAAPGTLRAADLIEQLAYPREGFAPTGGRP